MGPFRVVVLPPLFDSDFASRQVIHRVCFGLSAVIGNFRLHVRVMGYQGVRCSAPAGLVESAGSNFTARFFC